MLDVMRFMIEASCGPAAVEAFNRDLLPTLRLRPEAYRELTESEYKAATAQVLKELPVYLRALLDHQF
jgi:hypothetical protein